MGAAHDSDGAEVGLLSEPKDERGGLADADDDE